MKPPAPTLALVTQILCEQLALEPEQVKPESGFSKDLGADSLEMPVRSEAACICASSSTGSRTGKEMVLSVAMW